MSAKIKYSILCATLVVGSSLILSFVSQEPSKRVFQYSDGYSFSQIILRDNGQFKQRISSCTYTYNLKGTWEEKGDTLVLHQKIVRGKSGTNEYADRYRKYLIKSDAVLENVWWRDILGASRCMHLQD